MPTIPEEPEMEDYVNWEQAAPASGTGLDIDFDALASVPMAAGPDDMNLVFENLDGDDFSFLALEHYAQSNMAPLEAASAPGASTGADLSQGFDLGFHWETPEFPCEQCRVGSYQCKRIREGSYKGYCTSCVALRRGCSFSVAAAENVGECYGNDNQACTFPANPWPTMGDHPNAIPHEEDDMVPCTRACSKGKTTTPTPISEESISPTGPPKIGARFSRESARILKNWLKTHGHHPYPSEEEKESLQRLTGLNKTQVTNWLANARRRGKMQRPRSTSPHVRTLSGPIDIPKRAGTPSPFDNMRNAAPFSLQRWANSPPENEPADVTDIARAVTASSRMSSGLNSPHSFTYTDDGTSRSICVASTASTRGTSHSSGSSFASAYSHGSRGSFGSFGSSMNSGKRRRRRRAAPKRPDAKTPLVVPHKTFQCTFCTETFRTKHDWQRHEKSLHLSLERWVCTPSGPTAVNPETGLTSCVFCGEANPDKMHFETHNHSTCLERSLDERTFYRKDHLRQHLKLVHSVKFVSWSMEQWKQHTPAIRSRCGFCGIALDSWQIRIDHLAEHFKTGDTMANWKGDWGFEPQVLDLVEDAIPPYLIEDERNSPLPYTANLSPPETPRNAYELIKSEIAEWVTEHRVMLENEPTQDEMQVEACRIIFGSEVLSTKDLSYRPSWLRDLLMANDTLRVQAQLAPIRRHSESRMAKLLINGKDNLFEACPLETQLHEYVKGRENLGLTAMDHELQVKACELISSMEDASTSTLSDVFANLLIRLANQDTKWLSAFRQRARLPRSEDIVNEIQRSTDPTTIDASVHNYSRLEFELRQYMNSQRAAGLEPSNADLQRQARIIVYEVDDNWNQTAADNPAWLDAFRERLANANRQDIEHVPLTVQSLQGQSKVNYGQTAACAAAFTARVKGVHYKPAPSIKATPFFLNHANCYRRLSKELSRYCVASMSQHNPNRHVPTDQELQHQARWILYDDDDPWNVTAADNAEWLQRFKRDVGILTDSGPGLPADLQWAIKQGGSGFAPPYAFPKASFQPVGTDGQPISIEMREGARSFDAGPATVNKFLQTFTQRYPAPASVFCSRELESGLETFTRDAVSQAGGAPSAFPSDAQLQQRAREIIGMPTTAADNVELLGKFKTMMQSKLDAEQQQTMVAQSQDLLGTGLASAVAASTSADVLGDLGDLDMPFDMELSELSQKDLTNILDGMELDFGNGQLDLGGGALLR